jgi:hypothetical protein
MTRFPPAVDDVARESWKPARIKHAAHHVFPTRVDRADHLSTRQYARLVDEWVLGVGLRREEYGTHSLRRTKASIIYKATGNLRAMQILLGHTKIENTVRYLGVDVEDALTLAERTETRHFLRLSTHYHLEHGQRGQSEAAPGAVSGWHPTRRLPVAAAPKGPPAPAREPADRR